MDTDLIAIITVIIILTDPIIPIDTTALTDIITAGNK
jgi:hypothetical protein